MDEHIIWDDFLNTFVPVISKIKNLQKNDDKMHIRVDVNDWLYHDIYKSKNELPEGGIPYPSDEDDLYPIFVSQPLFHIFPPNVLNFLSEINADLNITAESIISNGKDSIELK